jgi:hypothetical protein
MALTDYVAELKLHPLVWENMKIETKMAGVKGQKEVNCFQLASHATHKYNILRQVTVHQQPSTFLSSCSSENIFSGVKTLYRAKW